MFLKKIFSSKKNKITNDDILNLFKYVNWQVKLVDVVCQRDKKTYKTKNKQLISLMNSDWVCGYIIGLSIQYFSNMKLDMKENIDVIIDDTDENYSSKIKNMNLIGAPYQIVLGKKTEGNLLEFKEFKKKEALVKSATVKFEPTRKFSGNCNLVT